MNKKISLGLALSLIAVSIAVTFILTSFFSLQSFNEKVADVNEKAKKYSDLQEIDTIVRNDYFGEINEQYLEDEMLKGYVSGLDDKYSRYLTAEEYLSEKNENSGTLVGLGIVVEEDESGYIRIADIYNSSPASDSGLMEDDLIITVDGINTKKIGTDEALNLIKGTEGSDVSMTIRRNGVDTEYKFTRRAVTLDTVESEMLGNYIGYIKISGFKENTPDQFIDALERLTANGAK
ncbi:MAG: PDZ domain-containing protein, partial [Ruminococcus sp.]|nr:PDZ domain-containing protein [Ruminococcus sp.]